jgi:hypothetical protein
MDLDHGVCRAVLAGGYRMFCKGRANGAVGAPGRFDLRVGRVEPSRDRAVACRFRDESFRGNAAVSG